VKNRIRSRLLLAVLFAGCAWVAWAADSSPAPPRRVADSSSDTGYAFSWADGPPVASRQFALQGVASCASTACHGRNGPQASKRSEYTTWMTQHDKHLEAYTVLLNDRSRRIEKNYRSLASLQDAHAEKDETCLRCHSMDAKAAAKGEAIATADGIGCERCHGPAERWLGEHYLRGWEHKSVAEKAALGFFPTKDLVARGRLCADCHVGSAGQDVDHDLIAAGHPRLHFEYAAYLDLMPAHWSRREEKARYPDLEARVWAVGQVVSAEMALELLAHRAETQAKPWPEFAEYDCYACHHGLHPDSPRQALRGTRILPGSLPWSTWYYAMLPRALDMEHKGSDAAQVEVALRELQKRMREPGANRGKIAEQAHSTARHLSAYMAPPGAGDLVSSREMFDTIAKDQWTAQETSWDSATQCYLALAALHRAMLDRDPSLPGPRRREGLQRMAEQLRFAPDYDMPRVFDPVKFGQQRQRLHDLLDQ
jgi:hypothetical protein